MLDRSESRKVPHGTDTAARAKRVAAIAAAHADAVDREGRFPREAVAAMREERLLGMMIPTHLGGDGADFAEIAQVCTRLAWSFSITTMTWSEEAASGARRAVARIASASRP